MFHTGVKRRFTARHFLRGDFGPESEPHSHPYEVEWVCGVRGLDENGFGVDIAAMEDAMEDTLGRIDDRLLNDIEFFRTRQPSLENLAVYLEAKLSDRVSGLGVIPASNSVQIWESDTAWARYTADSNRAD